MATNEDIRKMREEEITLELKRVRDKLYTLRSQTVTDKVEDTSQLRKLRREVARLLTERHARRLAKA